MKMMTVVVDEKSHRFSCNDILHWNCVWGMSETENQSSVPFLLMLSRTLDVDLKLVTFGDSIPKIRGEKIKVMSGIGNLPNKFQKSFNFL